MISIKNKNQIEKMREAGKILYEVLQETKMQVKPGVTTKELDTFAEKLIRKNHGIPSFLGYGGYPASLCTSINEQIVHGIPSEKIILKPGDILSLDCGVELEGWQSDSALTVGVGEISEEAQKLIDTTEKCFWDGIKAAVAGTRLGILGGAIQNIAEREGYGVIRELTGHGIGREVHEDPSVFNFRNRFSNGRLYKGMTIAVEPMICTGDYHIKEIGDGWTYVTVDHSLASHYEHTIAITDGLPDILTYPGFEWKD